MASDPFFEPPPVHYDNEERFGTSVEMIAEIRRLRTALAARAREIDDEHDRLTTHASPEMVKAGAERIASERKYLRENFGTDVSDEWLAANVWEAMVFAVIHRGLKHPDLTASKPKVTDAA